MGSSKEVCKYQRLPYLIGLKLKIHEDSESIIPRMSQNVPKN